MDKSILGWGETIWHEPELHATLPSMTKDSRHAESGKKYPRKDQGRRGGVRSLGALIPAITRKAVGKRGFATASIITDWERIVGPDLAASSQPDRVSFPKNRRDGGTVYIRAEGPLATELAHLESLVVERINTHFGYRAVERIKLLQVPSRHRTGGMRRMKTEKAKPESPLDPEVERDLEHSLEQVADPDLRDLLRRLGRSVMRHEIAKKPE